MKLENGWDDNQSINIKLSRQKVKVLNFDPLKRLNIIW